jgi:hypothetical protein
MIQTIRAATWGVVLLVLGGCARVPQNDVTLRVTLDGAPLAEAEVRLNPKTDADLGSYLGTTDAAGVAVMQGDRRFPDAIRPGEYRVLIRMPGPPPLAAQATSSRPFVPPIYSDPTRSPLTVVIKPGTNAPPPLELHSRGRH